MKKKTATKAPAGKKPSSKKTGNQEEEVVSTEPVETPVEEVAASTELEIPVEDEQLAAKTKGGKRNNDKFRFNDFPNALGKGPLVREIMKDYTSKHKKATLKQLDEIWKPKDLLKRFGIYAEINEARELSSARDRYFFQEEHQIRLADKKLIVVSNQQTNSTLQSFIKAAKALGYKISVAK